MSLLLTLVAAVFVAISGVIAYLLYLAPSPHDDLM
jgi:hypothetical protein